MADSEFEARKEAVLSECEVVPAVNQFGFAGRRL